MTDFDGEVGDQWTMNSGLGSNCPLESQSPTRVTTLEPTEEGIVCFLCVCVAHGCVCVCVCVCVCMLTFAQPPLTRIRQYIQSTFWLVSAVGIF